jgi:hypothetical protein
MEKFTHFRDEKHAWRSKIRTHINHLTKKRNITIIHNEEDNYYKAEQEYAPGYEPVSTTDTRR